AAAMARALVLGESDLLSADDRAFKASGLAHLLAVSGTHLVFAVVALVRALTALLVRVEHLAARFDVTRGAAAVGALAALVYADYAGGTGSAWRAAWMLAVVFGVRALGRRVAPGRALALSVVIGAALEPLCAFDVSFMLSAAATLGLLWAGSPLSLRLAPCRPAPLRWLSQSLVVTVCAMLACAPLLAVFSPGLTAAGAFANVLAAPLGEVVALPLCLGHALLGGAPALERGAALVASGALLLVKKLAHLSAGVRVLAFHLPVPSPWHWVLIATGAIGVASVPPARARAFRMAWLAATFAGLFLLECAQDRARAPTGRLRVTVLDVGQGDSLLVDFPDGRAMLIDGGGVVGTDVDPGKLVILPLLRGRRRARIDVVVLTHPHPDHFLGLVSVADAIPIGEFWDSGQGEEEGAGVTYAGLVRTLRMRGVPVRRPGALCDRPRSFGGATVEVLAPCPNFVARRPPNDNSFVLRIRYRERVALLMGDAEALEEGELVERLGGSLRADFLKVGHHGSRTSSTPSFIREVDPWLSVISCGVRNRFGHPHAQTLELLGHRSVGMARTDRFGSVMWQTDGRSLEARAFSMFH
ncbi:MAG TPA: DNA internalization-related competence protein ComEC/Rec2, partial [Polyangiaceae bacterium]